MLQLIIFMECHHLKMIKLKLKIIKEQKLKEHIKYLINFLILTELQKDSSNEID